LKEEQLKRSNPAITEAMLVNGEPFVRQNYFAVEATPVSAKLFPGIATKSGSVIRWQFGTSFELPKEKNVSMTN
jgi:hypothetical protein